MQPWLSLVALGVRDLEAATRFYRDGMGLPLSPVSQADISFFSLRGATLVLYGWNDLADDAATSPAGQGFRGVTLAHNVHTPEEVPVVLAQAEAAGGRIIRPAEKTSWGGFRGYFADLDGHLWEVVYNPFIPLSEEGLLGLPE